MRTPLVIIVLAIAGCAETTPGEINSAPEPIHDPVPQQIEGPSVEQLKWPTNVTELHWGYSEPLTNYTLELSLDFAPSTVCDHDLRASFTDGESLRFGVFAMLLVENGDSVKQHIDTPHTFYARVAASRGQEISVHASQADSRELLAGVNPVAAGSVGGGVRGFHDGINVVTIFGSGLEARPDAQPARPMALAYSISCDEPFSVVEAREGIYFQVDQAESMSGGAGFNGPEGAANVGDFLEASTEGETVVAAGVFSLLGVHQYAVDVSGTGAATWDFGPDTASGGYGFGKLEGPAGNYHIEVTGLQAGSEFWAGAWSFSGAAEPDGRLLATTAT